MQLELGSELPGPALYQTPHLTAHLTPHLTPPALILFQLAARAPRAAQVEPQLVRSAYPAARRPNLTGGLPIVHSELMTRGLCLAPPCLWRSSLALLAPDRSLSPPSLKPRLWCR